MKQINKILIAEEKHGTRYFDASTPEALNAAAFSLLKERWDEGYWYYLGDPPENKDVLPYDQIDSLPTQSLKDSELKRRTQYLRDLHSWQNEEKEYNAIKDCVENNLLDKAWKLLQSRSDGEYEKVEIETLEQP